MYSSPPIHGARIVQVRFCVNRIIILILFISHETHTRSDTRWQPHRVAHDYRTNTQTIPLTLTLTQTILEDTELEAQWRLDVRLC